MAILMGTLFLGSIGLTQYLGVLPQGEETILSALARRLLDRNPFYFLVQGSTLLVLAVAANTSFAGFPRVASVLARATVTFRINSPTWVIAWSSRTG